MDLKYIIEIFAVTLGVIGGIIISLGALISLIRYLVILPRRENKKFSRGKSLDQIRLNFGRHITFGLEFFIAKDVIETIFVPSWTELGQLAALVGIRIALSFFLARELKIIEK